MVKDPCSSVEPAGSQAGHPTSPQGVSVVVIAYNEEETIQRCLKSLLSQTHSPYEVILVDDSSTDRTPELAQEIVAGDPRVRIVRTDGKSGVSRAFNLGVSHSRYPVLAFTGSDCIVGPDWLGELLLAMERERAPVSTGSFTSASQDNRWSRVEDKKVLDWTRSRLERGEPFLIGANMAIDRGLFLDLGGYDEGLTSKVDKDMGQRIIDSGNPIAYAPGATILHEHPIGLWEYFGRGRWYALGLCRYNEKHHGSWYSGPDFWRLTEVVWLILGLGLLAASIPLFTYGPALGLLLAIPGLALVALGFRREVGMLGLVVLGRFGIDTFILDLVSHTGEKAGCLGYLWGRVHKGTGGG